MRPIVYFSKEITSESLVKIFDCLNRNLSGKVGIKISTGEAGGNNYLHPEFIEELVKKLNGTIIECNTAYPGKRNTTDDHKKTIKDHGFYDIADVDIMDEDGDITINVTGGKHLGGINYVGKNLLNYDSILVLSHFKGHEMGGFGGALKNIAIGMASSRGKSWIHSGGKVTDPNILWNNIPHQDIFLESMAEACESVISKFKENMVYVNVANRLSVDCDCSPSPAEPRMADIGILSSLDPVALDKACVDLVYASSDPGKKHLIERIETRHGIHTINEAERLGLGRTDYILVEI